MGPKINLILPDGGSKFLSTGVDSRNGALGFQLLPVGRLLRLPLHRLKLLNGLVVLDDHEAGFGRRSPQIPNL